MYIDSFYSLFSEKAVFFSAAEPHNFYAVPFPGKNIDDLPTLTPTHKVTSQFLKCPKVETSL
jgi:hypothetical protein